VNSTYIRIHGATIKKNTADWFTGHLITTDYQFQGWIGTWKPKK